jgi:HAMP domain-containing protein
VLYTIIALEIAAERSREVDRIRLARLAHASAAGMVRRPPSRPGRGIRAIVARPVRALGSAAGTVSHAACSAATRIEGAAG